ncbi:guanylate kinase [Paenibacillus mucilaginosus]|uniref:Guanylate kinase n=3 Tax=Paenibacillus mucilaginosus TaxID=61624 RepID=H6NSA6_9BACL|nr:guanylate kinase [Paenibacillus mucilaginosus]AEI39109.1 guanylate kinase [Paenibacillus mucilaginosus KNP414]AFC27400.1 guanylate kinase [Paenibacillus mucilaginosus 3016]AFH59545.1 guanylate kinase [Paenibacillus mucilaginosus K02]MCG7216234.1 guanylate kinase [Paenibacillus mucilaginosus]WDM28132.1 guanylate kinase [Paenibacillus mucilaginosus]
MYELKDKEIIFVFTGPNGAGRRTVAQMSGSTLGVKQVISYTTRPPRSSEVDGQDYHFVSREEFKAAEEKQEFIEVIEIDGNCYGIKEADVAAQLQKFGAVYLVLNRFGAEALKKVYGDKVVRIFIYADRETVLKREQERGDTPELIERYMSHYEEEMAYKDSCEHVFENLDLAHTVFDLTKALDDTYLHRNLLDLD